MSKSKKKSKGYSSQPQQSQTPAAQPASQSIASRITSAIAIPTLAICGVLAYMLGLRNQFIGDDTTQILDNPVVHSLSNVWLLFQGGTFYVGHGLAPLSGAYYRPMMAATFSALYTLFGPHAEYYHLLQLILCIANAILLYLIFSRIFNSFLSLILSLIFLVHPIDSQVVYAIPALQDALFFFFGLLAFWLLLRSTSLRNLLFAALCIFLSLLSKESGVLFLIMSLIYIIWFRREQLRRFAAVMIAPVIFYAILHMNAIRNLHNPHLSPIDSLSLLDRMLTMPSVLLFYLGKLLFPLHLASGYYWVNETLTFRGVILPLLVDAALVLLVWKAASTVKQRVTSQEFRWFHFFLIWSVLGVVLVLQLYPLDMTACETWFYFSMAGILGMAGVLIIAIQKRLNEKWFIVGAAILITALGVRTALRAQDWANGDALARRDIVSSPQDYTAYNYLAGSAIDRNDYPAAKDFAQKSINIYPHYTNLNNLGVALVKLGDYAAAMSAFERSLKITSTADTSENLAYVTLFTGDFDSNKQLINNLLQAYPHDATIWMYLALLEQRAGENNDAKFAIQQAAANGQKPPYYDAIINNRHFTLQEPEGTIQI